MQTSPHARVSERLGFLLRLIFLPMGSVAFFGVLIGVSVMAVFFRRSLPQAVRYIAPGGLVLLGWGLLHALVFLLFYALAQRSALRRARALLGPVIWARQGWWTSAGQRNLGLVGVAQGRLLVAPLDGDALSHCFDDVRALELLPPRRPLQMLLGHGELRVFRENGETWDALVCGSRKALHSLRAALELAPDPAEAEDAS